MRKSKLYIYIISHWIWRNANTMSRDFYYDDIKIIKKPLKQRVKSSLKIFLIFLFLVGIIVSSLYISKALTDSNLSSVFVYGGRDIKIDSREMYAITLGKYSTREEADRVALGATIQGAGGYVWQNKDDYYVLGNIYNNNDSALLVKGNLKDTNYSVDILKISMPKIKLNFDEMENKSVAGVRDSINYFYECYDKLYNYCILFDKSEMNNLAISSYISQMRGEVKVCISEMQGLINTTDYSNLQVVQSGLIKLDELLDQAIIKTIDNSSTSSYLKYAICLCVNIEYSMRQNLV